MFRAGPVQAVSRGSRTQETQVRRSRIYFLPFPILPRGAHRSAAQALRPFLVSYNRRLCKLFRVAPRASFFRLEDPQPLRKRERAGLLAIVACTCNPPPNRRGAGLGSQAFGGENSVRYEGLSGATHKCETPVAALPSSQVADHQVFQRSWPGQVPG